MISLTVKQYLKFEVLHPIFDNTSRCFVFVIRDRFRVEGRGEGIWGSPLPFSEKQKRKEIKKIDVNVMAEI